MAYMCLSGSSHARWFGLPTDFEIHKAQTEWVHLSTWPTSYSNLADLIAPETLAPELRITEVPKRWIL